VRVGILESPFSRSYLMPTGANSGPVNPPPVLMEGTTLSLNGG
jgi:hypothetical protein